MRIITISSVCAALAVAPAWADHASIGIGVGTASPIATETGVTLPKGRWIAGLRSEFIEFDQFSDQEFLNDADGHRHGTNSLFSTSLGVFYGLTDNLTVGLRLPYVHRFNLKQTKEVHTEHAEAGASRPPPRSHGGVDDGGGDDDHGGGGPGTALILDEQGDSADIGDLLLIGQYRFLNIAETQHASFLFGLKTPTGNTRETSTSGDTFEAEFQPGSGSWDGFFGLAYTYWFAPFSFDASILYTIVTEGTQDTDLGDVFNYNFALSYRLGAEDQGVFYGARKSSAWDLILELNGEWREKTVVGERVDPDHGGHVLYVSPGVRYSPGSNWSIALSFGAPAVVDLNGDHVEPDYRILSNISLSF